MDARVGPALLPAIQIGLRFLQTLEAHSFERRFLRVADPRLHFPLAIGILGLTVGSYRSGTSTASFKLSRTTTRVQPPKRRNAFSCSSAQMRALERHVSKRTDLRL
jgi:hypothetical protein